MKNKLKTYLKNSGFTLTVLFMALYCCYIIRNIDDGSNFAFHIFLVAVVIVSRFTKGYIYGFAASLLSTIGFHVMVNYPNYVFRFPDEFLSASFAAFIIVSVVICEQNTRIDEYKTKNGELVSAIEKYKTKLNLLRGASHDLRTPLTGIMGAADTLIERGDDIDDKARMRLLSDTKNDAQWLLCLTGNILSAAKVEDGTPISKRPEAVEEVAAESVERLKKHYKEQNITVTVPDELLMVPMDFVLIEQVLINLLENACIHSGQADEINLKISSENGEAVFMLTDNGCGIDDEVIDKLFEEPVFSQRSENEKEKKRNMGIGLYVCRTIIEAHGGTISAYNNEQGGATFRFTLPLMEGENEIEK
ncbi:MAG TPA: sensor histidine kinase [Clostridiales bacterium]|nr:ATP-binding protein [Eubacteriales bacterium]HBR30539.1 sensor histidine kinase [Clostridiales bacterium]